MIHTLVMSGEKGRALAAIAVQGERSSGPATLVRLRELFPNNDDPTPKCNPPAIDVPGTALAAGREAVKALRSPSKLSAPGLVGGRAEHWQALAKDASYAETLAGLLGRIAVGLVPPDVARAFRVCEVDAFPQGKR